MCPLLFMIKSARTRQRTHTHTHTRPFTYITYVYRHGCVCVCALGLYAKYNAACVHTRPSLNHATTLTIFSVVPSPSLSRSLARSLTGHRVPYADRAYMYITANN